MSLGTRLRRLRMERGLTQAELAAPDYTHAYVSSIEAGRRTPSRIALDHFASRLGVDADELATGRPANLTARLLMQMHEARRLVSSGKRTEAEAIYKRVAGEAEQFDLPIARAKAEQGIAFCAERNGDIESAIDRYEIAERLLDGESPLTRVDAIAGRARCLQMLGDTRYAVYVLESLLQLLEHRGLQDPDALVRIHASLVAGYFELGLYDKASASANTALNLAPRASDPEQLANMHINAARVLLHEGRTGDAEESLKKAEQLYRQLDLRSETGSAYLAQGFVLAREGRPDEAREKLRLALDFLRDYPNPVDEACALNELARLERLDGNLTIAEELLEKSIARLQDSDVSQLAIAHRELALCQMRSDPQNAEKNLKRAIELYDRAAEPIQLAITYRALGDLLKDQGESSAGSDAYRTGIMSLEEALFRSGERTLVEVTNSGASAP